MANIGSQKVELLDTTLRDGSYAVDFQFTQQDTAVIALSLEKLGFRWIEIGHGLGLNASLSNKGKGAASDEDYLKAASSVLKKAKFGMFFIPGIGRLSDLDMAKRYGMDFVRIGTNANEVKAAKDAIVRSKRLGLTVSLNLMKSYVLSPQKLYENAKRSVDMGADIVCLVDSAGCMLPEEVEAYFDKLLKLKGIILGFHGHDNLGLAVANSLKAVECGASLIDVSLQGLGRSAGNAPSEILIAILQRKNKLADTIDLYKTLEFAHKVISPMAHNVGLDPISIISGYARFHSSFTKIVKKYADRYGVDPKMLIVDLCAIDQVNASERIVKDIALKLHRKNISLTPNRPGALNVDLGFGGKNFVSPGGVGSGIELLTRQLRSLSKKQGKLSVINLVIDRRKEISISGFVQESPYFIIGTLEVGNAALLRKALKLIDGKIDYILTDCESKIFRGIYDTVRNEIKRSGVLAYKDNDSWARAIFQQVLYILQSTNKKIAILGFNNLSLKLSGLLSEVGFEVVLTSNVPDNAKKNKDIIEALNASLVEFAKPIVYEPDSAKACVNADAVVGLVPGKAVVTKEAVASMKKSGIIVDGGLGSIDSLAVEKAILRGIKIIRVDMGPVIPAEVASGIRSKDLLENRMGKDVIDFNRDDASATNTGQAIMALDIAVFGDVGEFKRRVDTVVRDLRASRRMPGVERIWVPGEQSEARRIENAREGIPMAPALMQSLGHLKKPR